MTARIPTLLLTGAAGLLGRQLAPALARGCERVWPLQSAHTGAPQARRLPYDRLVRSDLPAALQAQGDTTAVPCDLADRAAVRTLLQGVDAVVHLGGVSYEKPFEVVLEANIRGLFHLYEAARLAGTKRIVFASSNHVTGCYAVTDHNAPEDPPRPDGYYGLSKLYGEGMASLYFDRYGIETVCLRIGTATPEPIDHRSLASWLSPGDLERLVMASLTTPGVGFLVAYGCSRNTRRWWQTDETWARLGYAPQDDAEAYASKVGHITFPPGSPMARLQGGSFLGIGPFDDKET